MYTKSSVEYIVTVAWKEGLTDDFTLYRINYDSAEDDNILGWTVNI